MSDSEETYLANVPEARTLLATKEQEYNQHVVATLHEQSTTVAECVNMLTYDKPSITFNLAGPLDSRLRTELLNKGYCVSESSSWTNENGSKTQWHQVTVMLPNAGNQWHQSPVLPRFTFPRRSLWPRWW